MPNAILRNDPKNPFTELDVVDQQGFKLLIHKNNNELKCSNSYGHYSVSKVGLDYILYLPVLVDPQFLRSKTRFS